MVKLDNENIYNYFSVATNEHSALIVGKKLFDFVDRQSQTLVVTLGDSWTWGADLTQDISDFMHLDRRIDDGYRIKNVYGNQIADLLGSDFLNLGESGSGNWYIVRKLRELLAVQSLLQYEKIIIFGIWTELGRDLNSSEDASIDYRSWLLQNIGKCSDYYDFMEFINAPIAQNVHDLIKKFDPRFAFYFGTNFVDPIGVDVLAPYWLDQTWLEIICKNTGKIYEPKQCYSVFPWVIEKFSMVFDVAPELDRLTWLQWVNEITDLANQRAEICERDDVNFGPLLHPLSDNHQCWAKYLFEVIDE